MIEAWLNLPAAGIFAVLTALYTVTGAVIVWLTFGPPLGPRVRKLEVQPGDDPDEPNRRVRLAFTRTQPEPC